MSLTTIAILVVLAAWAVLAAVAVRAYLYEPSCPHCGGRSIESVDLHTATVIVDGQRVPAAWMYRVCHDCGARLKWSVGEDRWIELEPGEWEQVVRSQHR